MGLIKIEAIDDKIFELAGKAFLRGQYTVEYPDIITGNNGVIVDSDKALVFLRPNGFVNTTYPLRQQPPIKSPLPWFYFCDGENEKYPDFETFTLAIADIVGGASIGLDYLINNYVPYIDAIKNTDLGNFELKGNILHGASYLKVGDTGKVTSIVSGVNVFDGDQRVFIPTNVKEKYFCFSVNGQYPTDLGNINLESVYGKQYRALLSQTGTHAPTAAVLGLNAIGVIVWTRTDIGNYRGTLTGAFPIGRTFIPPVITTGQGNTTLIQANLNANYIEISTFDSSNEPQDDLLDFTGIEIQVYPS